MFLCELGGFSLRSLRLKAFDGKDRRENLEFAENETVLAKSTIHDHDLLCYF
jgi:hypothetical protein